MSASRIGAIGPTASRDLSIFVSYRQRDVATATDLLAGALREQFGRDHVFVDADTIDPGARFADAIARWIERSDVLLVIIGDRWQPERLRDPSDYVRLEVEAGLRRGIRVIPVLVHDASLPQRDELPESVVALIDLQAARLGRPHWDDDVDQLLTALHRISAAKAKTEEPPVARFDSPPRAPESPPVTLYPAARRRGLIGAGLGAIAAAAIVVILLTSSGSPPAQTTGQSSTSPPAVATGTTSPTTSSTMSPPPASPKVVNGHWSGTAGPLTIAVTQVKQLAGTVTMSLTASSGSAITVEPFINNLEVTTPSGQSLSESSQNDYNGIDVPPGGQIKASFQVTGVPASARTLSVFFPRLFSADPTLITTLNSGLRITGVPVPR